MGQYYYGVMNASFDGKQNPIAFRNIEPGFLKLMEHSWWKNPYVNWFCKKLTEASFRVGWVGDYSDSCGCPDGIFLAAHGCDAEDEEHPKYTETIRVCDNYFTLNDKYLVNHSKKQYLDCTKYYRESIKYSEWYHGAFWVVHPLPLLTCIGNGLGGGDYRGINKEKAGFWFWDILEVCGTAPEGYEELNIAFGEKQLKKGGDV